MITMSNHLRLVLDSMFPSSYLNVYHPVESCTLLELKCRLEHDSISTSSSHRCQVSSEPGNRVQIRSLANRLDTNLKSHLARPIGLCPIRRAIFDQCLDELIRQTTINCLESGLLLFRVRNELRGTINCYKNAYESGVKFGLKKALSVELELEKNKQIIHDLESKVETSVIELSKRLRSEGLEEKNRNDSSQRMKTFYEKEVAKRDQIIEQQRAIIKALSQNITSELTSNQSRQ